MSNKNALYRTLLLMTAATATTAATCKQHTFVTINRPGAQAKYRVVAYGDSIYAGYDSSAGFTSVARRADPVVLGEYLAKSWNASVEVLRLTESGATASQIYNDEVRGNASFMNASTRVVMLDSCGNDYLQARTTLNGQSGTCNFGVLDTALANCIANTSNSMSSIATNANGKNATRLVTTLYYPGYNADAGTLACTDPATGQPGARQDIFLRYLAHSNWQTCQSAQAHGFRCVDLFAEYMGADIDTNGDGAVDADQLRVSSASSEDDYVTRITSTYRSLVSDALAHKVSSTASYDYILTNDDTHPTYSGGTQSCTTGSPSNMNVSPAYTDAQIVDGKNPVWNQFGHEKGGWAASQ